HRHRPQAAHAGAPAATNLFPEGALMTSPVNVEETLERMGTEWPAGDSVVDRVLRGLEHTPRRPKPTPAPRPLLKSALVVAASVAAVAVVWSALRPGATVYAQARDAVHRARTFQLIVRSLAEGDKPDQPFMAVSYARGVGFREDGPTETVFGNSDGLW